MAKKVVATLQKKESKNMAKIIRAVKSDKGSYSFKEEIVPVDQVQEALKG